MLIATLKGAQGVQFAPHSSRFVVQAGTKWAIGDLNTRQLQSARDLPSEDADGNIPVFSSDGRAFGWLQTTTEFDHIAGDGTIFPDFMPGSWTLSVWSGVTGCKTRVVHFFAPASSRNKYNSSFNEVKHIAWNASAQEVRVWDMEPCTNSRERKWAAIDPASNTLEANHIQLFNDSTGQQITSQLCPVAPILTLKPCPDSSACMMFAVTDRFSFDGQTLSRCDDDQAIFLDSTTGRVLWRWANVSRVQFSPDGKLAIASIDESLIACDARTGRESWRCALPSVQNWTLTPDGNSVLEIRADGSIWNWPLSR